MKKDDLAELIFLYAITSVCVVLVGSGGSLPRMETLRLILTLDFWLSLPGLFIVFIYAIISFRAVNLLRTEKQ